jgi:hypothetical protein
MLSEARALYRRSVPWPVQRAVLETWLRTRSVRDCIAACALGFRLIAARSPFPNTLLFFGLSPGDDLLCTAVLREMRRRRQINTLMISNHGQLFAGNPDVADVWPAGQQFYVDGSTVSIYRQFARIWQRQFKRLGYAPFDGGDQSEPPSRHIIADMCASAGIKGPISIRPYLVLTEEEKAGAAWAGGRIVVQSSGMGARHPMRNKEWYAERIQGVIDCLYRDLEFIQLGSASDPALRHVQDLRDRTNIRESAAILHHARLYVGTVGFLMHLARAVDCPSVIVYGGREAPWQSGYVCNINLYSALPCAPCWRWNSCDFERRCMDMISVDDAVSAIQKALSTPRGPLAVETIKLPC